MTESVQPSRGRGRRQMAALIFLGAAAGALLLARVHLGRRLSHTLGEIAPVEQSLRLEASLAQRIVRLRSRRPRHSQVGGGTTSARVVARLEQAASEAGMSREALAGVAPGRRRSEDGRGEVLAVTVKLSQVTRQELVLFLLKLEDQETPLVVDSLTMSRRAPTQTHWGVELVVSTAAAATAAGGE